MWSARDVVARIVELPERSGRSPTGAEPTLARVTRYGVAVVLTAGAWAATLGLTPTLPAANFLPFAAAVALATWYGGIGPGLLTSALSIAAIDFSFLPPIGSVELTHSEEWLDSGVFLVVALTISATTVALRHARRLADRRAHDLETANTDLADHTRRVEALSEELRASNEYLAEAHAVSERVALRATKLLEVTSALAEARSVDDVTRVILDRGLSVVEALRGYLAVVDHTDIRVLATRGYTTDGSPPARPGPITMTKAGEAPLVDAIRLRAPIWLTSAEEYRRRYPRAFERFGAVSAKQAHVVVPLLHAGEPIGAIGISFADPSASGAADRAFTLLLAQAAATALQRARSYDDEREKRRDAELLARGREEVLGIVAHDLRNPLHLMVAIADLLDVPEMESERRRRLAAMTKRAADQMNRLVADLLDAVRIQSGRMSLDLSDVSVGALLEQAEEMCRPIAAERGVELTAQTSDADVLVHADKARVQQVLGNLIGNAVKFTAPGGRVRIEARAGAESVLLRVVDDGPGIPADRLPHLFEQFWQGRNGDRRGVGLGLAIAKGIVDAHGGRIWVESVPGQGSIFSFSLPIGAPAASAASARAASVPDRVTAATADAHPNG